MHPFAHGSGNAFERMPFDEHPRLALRLAAAKYVLRLLVVEDLPAFALALLNAGSNNPHFACLAGAVRSDTANDLHDLFRQGMASEGIELPTELDAALLLRNDVAQGAMNGAVTPEHGGNALVKLLHLAEQLLPRGNYIGN